MNGCYPPLPPPPAQFLQPRPQPSQDGVGDFGGLIQRLDYVAGLGVDVIWLLPLQFRVTPRTEANEVMSARHASGDLARQP